MDILSFCRMNDLNPVRIFLLEYVMKERGYINQQSVARRNPTSYEVQISGL